MIAVRRLQTFVVGVALCGCGRLGFDTPARTVEIGDWCETDIDCAGCGGCDNGVCTEQPMVDLFLGHRNLCYLTTNGTRWCAGEYAGIAGDNAPIYFKGASSGSAG